MISANLTSKERQDIYRRDGWECALCGDPRNLQLHHIVPRSRGGKNHRANLITLCSTCHALAHGIRLYDTYLTQEDVEQGIVEYMADYYARSIGQVWQPDEEEQEPP